MAKIRKFDSYDAGYTDTCKRLKMDCANIVFQYPSKDAGELDHLEYLRGCVEAIVRKLQ